jgi:hypothetical protein
MNPTPPPSQAPPEPGSLLIIAAPHAGWLARRLALVFGLGVLVGGGLVLLAWLSGLWPC